MPRLAWGSSILVDFEIGAIERGKEVGTKSNGRCGCPIDAFGTRGFSLESAPAGVCREVGE